MPEALEDRPRLLLPMAVVSLYVEPIDARVLADGYEPRVQFGPVRRKLVEQLLDALDRPLDAVDLEALVVVAVDSILLKGSEPLKQRVPGAV